MRARNLLVGLAAMVVTPGLASATTTIFSDGTFAKKHYVQTPSDASTGAAITERTCTLCGDPGRGLLFQIAFPDAFGTADLGVVNSTWTYDPETQGDITSIAVSVEKDLTFTPRSKVGGVSTFRPLIEQGGVYYLASVAGGTFDPPLKSTGWLTISAAGLTASDFDEFDFATGSFIDTDHPNFDGGTMVFGLAQISASGAFVGKENIDFDNLSFAVTSVPEPTSWAMMILGTAGLGLAARRRTRARARARSRK